MVCDRDMGCGQGSNNLKAMFVANVSATEVEHIIEKRVENSYTSGPDEFPRFLLRKIAEYVAEALSRVIYRPLKRGTFTTRLKTSSATINHKKGDRKDMHNYRPTSLASI